MTELRQRVDVARLARLLSGWSDEPGPLPERLATAVRRLITAGELADGVVLPAQRGLALGLGVARSTVTEAYELLAGQGWVESRQGSGSRVRLRGGVGAAPPGPTSASTDGRLSTFTHADVPHDLSSGALPGLSRVGTAFAALDPSVLAVELGGDGYHPAGHPTLRAAVARRFCADGLRTSPDQILVTSGAQQAVWLVANALVSAGDTVAVEDPSYRGAIEAFTSRGARLVTVPVRPEGIDVKLLDRILARGRVRLLYCQPAAHNPTGLSWSDALRREVAETAGRHGVFVLEDSCSIDLVLDDKGVRSRIAADLPSESVATVGTASKLFWGGLRVGWIRASAALVAQLTEVKKAIDLSGAIVDQLVVAALLDDADSARLERRDRLTRSLAELTGLLGDLAPAWTWDDPAGGAGLWVNTGTDALALSARARRRGVSVVAGPAFSAVDGFPRHLRLPLGRPLVQLEAALPLLVR